MGANAQKVEGLLFALADALGMRLIIHPSETGRRWVVECMKKFEMACGPDSVRDVSDKQLPYDLLVRGLKVQCKYRTRNRSGVVKIRNSHRATGGWYESGEVDFFAIAYGQTHFIVPYAALVRADGSFVNDMQVSSLWRFEDAWNISSSGHMYTAGGLFKPEDWE